MKRLSRDQELAQERREIDRIRQRPDAWRFAFYSLPSAWKDKHMVDSSMTLEEINAHREQYIRELIPFEWKEAICTCIDPNHYMRDGTLSGECKKCGKIARYRFFTCQGCKKKFISGAFKHHLLTIATHNNLVFGNFGARFWRVDEDTSVRLTSHCFDCLSGFCSSSNDEPPTVVPTVVRPIDEILTLDLDEDIPVFKF